MQNRTPKALKIWLVSVTFVLFQFFLQLSSGIVISAIMQEMTLSALIAGALSASFYIIYTGLQIPVGILFDAQNPRLLFISSALVCSVGCFTFAASHHLPGLFLSRTVIGIGSSFAFVGLSHLLRQYFPPKQFAFMIGLSETIGFLATVVGMIGMGALIHRFGWRGFINSAGILAIGIALSAYIYIPNTCPKYASYSHYKNQVWQICTNKKLMINGLFIGLTFMIVTVFGAMWASSFLQLKLHCGARDASIVNALFFLGAAVSCPLFGWLSTILARRRPMMLASSITTTILFITILYIPSQSPMLLGGLMLLLGLCCGAYILAYPIANELAPNGSGSTCTGFINTLALLSTPILQPIIGFILDMLHESHELYTLSNYQCALLVIPLCLLMACFLILYLPEKPRHS
jgi:MFS family permease